jgi:hypothetical protein
MDDTLQQTEPWRQPNTFMDIIAPNRVKNPLPKAPARSETLMRTAVKKPQPVQPAPRNFTVNTISTDNQLATQVSAHKTDHSEAASLTDKSPLISRFSANADISTEPEQQYPSMDAPTDLSVAAEPEQFNEQEIQAPQPIELAMDRPTISNVFANSLPIDLSSSERSRPVSRWHMAKRLSGWTVLAVVLIGLVGSGIYINSNFEKLELYLASNKAGFSATLPSIKPSGYDLNSISTGSGALQASFKSNSDSRTYSISESKSSISSGQLLTGYVLQKAGENYQTIQTDGKIIYVYGGQDATWVSKGIWYIVSDNNSLSNHQIIDIADSM